MLPWSRSLHRENPPVQLAISAESSELTGEQGGISQLIALCFVVVMVAQDSSAHPNNVFRAVVGYQDKKVNCIFLGEVHTSFEKNC